MSYYLVIVGGGEDCFGGGLRWNVWVVCVV